jgi:hypothetical protein
MNLWVEMIRNVQRISYFCFCIDILLNHMLSCPEEKMPIMMLFDEGMAR